MGAHAHPVQAASIGSRRGARRWRPPLRSAIVLVAASVAIGIVTYPETVRSAATQLCTLGTPAGTTCGEALVLLGYP